MKKISKNLVVAGLGLAIITSGSVFAEGGKALSDNNSLFSGNLVKEASLRDNYLDYKNLPQGEYKVNMKVMNANPNKKNHESMMNGAVITEKTKVIVDRAGNYYLDITLQSILKEYNNEKVIGYLDWLKYYDDEGNEQPSTVLSWQSDLKGNKHPKEIKFPISKPSEIVQKEYVEVYSKAMAEKAMKGAQVACPTIDWSNFSRISR